MRACGQPRVEDDGGHPRGRAAARNRDARGGGGDDARTGSTRDRAMDGTYLGNVQIVRAEVELIACVAEWRRGASSRSDPGGEGRPRRDPSGGDVGGGTTNASSRTAQGDHARLRRGDEIIEVAEFHRAGKSRHRVDSPATRVARDGCVRPRGKTGCDESEQQPCQRARCFFIFASSSADEFTPAPR